MGPGPFLEAGNFWGVWGVFYASPLVEGPHDEVRRVEIIAELLFITPCMRGAISNVPG